MWAEKMAQATACKALRRWYRKKGTRNEVTATSNAPLPSQRINIAGWAGCCQPHFPWQGQNNWAFRGAGLKHLLSPCSFTLELKYCGWKTQAKEDTSLPLALLTKRRGSKPVYSSHTDQTDTHGTDGKMTDVFLLLFFTRILKFY